MNSLGGDMIPEDAMKYQLRAPNVKMSTFICKTVVIVHVSDPFRSTNRTYTM